MFACVLLLAAPAQAHPDVDAARTAYGRGEVQAALVMLEQAERSPSITEDDLVQIHWYRAASLHALGRHDDAEKSLDALLELRPLFEPDRVETAPPLRAFFARRAEAYQRAHGVKLEAPILEGTTLRVPLSGKTEQVRTVQVFIRAPDEKTYRQFTLEASGREARGEVADTAVWDAVGGAGRVEVVLEARNKRGVPVARLGDAKEPVSVYVDARARAEKAARTAAPTTTSASSSEGGPARVLSTALATVGAGMTFIGGGAFLIAGAMAVTALGVWTQQGTTPSYGSLAILVGSGVVAVVFTAVGVLLLGAAGAITAAALLTHP
ncbi:MAG: hypothetical protein AB2A00_22685 [Myxococcota bacterium]